MSVSLSRKGIAVAVAVGLVTAGAVTSVSYAAGSAKTVSACANKKGQLGLLSKKNKCAKGFSKVAIAKQGPRGATGARGLRGVPGKTGAAGKTGPAGQQGNPGPGAVQLLLETSDSGIAPAVTVGSFSYRLGCDVDGTKPTATLYVKPASGVTGRIGTAYSNSTNDDTTATVKHFRTTFTSETNIFTKASSGTNHTYVDGMRVIGSDGTVQVVSVQLDADANFLPANGNRCVIAGAVIPTS